MRPHLLKEIKTKAGIVIDSGPEPEVLSELEISDQNFEIVKHALFGVVNDPGGTGRRAQLPDALQVKVGGKTGTSQVVAGTREPKSEHLQDHAWFVGFAPIDKPEIIAVALVENGGSGGRNAAPLVQQVLQTYFENKQPSMSVDNKIVLSQADYVVKRF